MPKTTSPSDTGSPSFIVRESSKKSNREVTLNGKKYRMTVFSLEKSSSTPMPFTDSEWKMIATSIESSVGKIFKDKDILAKTIEFKLDRSVTNKQYTATEIKIDGSNYDHSKNSGIDYDALIEAIAAVVVQVAIPLLPSSSPSQTTSKLPLKLGQVECDQLLNRYTTKPPCFILPPTSEDITPNSAIALQLKAMGDSRGLKEIKDSNDQIVFDQFNQLEFNNTTLPIFGNMVEIIKWRNFINNKDLEEALKRFKTEQSPQLEQKHIKAIKKYFFNEYLKCNLDNCSPQFYYSCLVLGYKQPLVIILYYRENDQSMTYLDHFRIQTMPDLTNPKHVAFICLSTQSGKTEFYSFARQSPQDINQQSQQQLSQLPPVPIKDPIEPSGPIPKGAQELKNIANNNQSKGKTKREKLYANFIQRKKKLGDAIANRWNNIKNFKRSTSIVTDNDYDD